MIRGILAFLLSAIAGGVFNMAFVTASQAIYPLPEGLDASGGQDMAGTRNIVVPCIADAQLLSL